MRQYFIQYSGIGRVSDTTGYLGEFENEDEALSEAYERACEDYNSYMGLHGIPDISEIMEEEDCDAYEAELISNENRESWVDYIAELYNPEIHDDYL